MRKKSSTKSVLISVENLSEERTKNGTENIIIESKNFDLFERKVTIIQTFWRKSKFKSNFNFSILH